MYKNAYVHEAFQFHARSERTPFERRVCLLRFLARVQLRPSFVCKDPRAASSAVRKKTGNC